MKVIVVYPFFMHYRKPVIDALIADARHDYYFAGDDNDRLGQIKPCLIEPAERFLRIKSFYLLGVLLQPGILRLLLTKKFDCIILLGNAAWPFTWVSAILARMLGKRVLFWTHGWVKKERGLRGRFRNLLYRLGHGVLLYGHVAKRIGLANGFNENSLYVVYNALDFENQKRISDLVTDDDISEAKKLFGDPALPIVICSSRLTPQRRLDLLFEAIEILKQKGRHVNILLVGDGPERTNLESLAEAKKLNVHFYGACYDENQLAKMTMAAAVTVAPGKVGLTAVQSLTFGTPVITHGNSDNQMPEHEVVVPGVTGAFFKEDNPSDLANVIDSWTSGVDAGKPCSACVEIVEDRYNPKIQQIIFDGAASGVLPTNLPCQETDTQTQYAKTNSDTDGDFD